MKKEETLKATLFAVGGLKFEVVMSPEREFSPKSLTDDTIQSFTRAGRNGVVIIQGSKIVALETH